ncbi:hypothetical protein IV203_019531 [Nitzschia inconspicua]|uniref:Uncharacterized protein n=1 Tax=Nitzschia inconspicua TaxID=303405 RepID=A0A9K3Q518_9STRA|nr:hypothetical protein IV203_019531 [Nitzschia inconspicua]
MMTSSKKKLSEAEKERLLLGEDGLTAFIVAEIEQFVQQTMHEYDTKQRYLGHKWTMPEHEKIQEGLMDAESGNITSQEYLEAVDRFQQLAEGNSSLQAGGGAQAVELICNTTVLAFQDGFRQQGLLSALGSAIIFFRSFYRTPTLIAACERVGLSDYSIAHHITDMYHHRIFRGAYTKTLQPSGKGEIAARIAVGIDDEDVTTTTTTNNPEALVDQSEDIDPHIDDECLLWSPTTPGLCLHWKSDNEAWRQRRFEKIQMEGTRDPRRGGSGTTR